MVSIYQFGFDIESDSRLWQKQIEDMFNIEFKLTENILDYPNKEKKWLEAVKGNMLNIKPFSFLGKEILAVYPSFNRYQSCVYLTIIFNNDITNDFDFIQKMSSYLKRHVFNFYDRFEIPFKEPESEDELDKYKEVLEIQNPVLVSSKFEDSTYVESKVISGRLYYKFEYKSQNFSKYTRLFRQVYISDNGNVSKEILEHFHSTFILFHRSYEFYKELNGFDEIRVILFEMSNAFNRIWPLERIQFSMLNRVWRSSLYNQTFLNVLELTAQIDTIISQLIISIQNLTDKYEKQYERVLHNFRLNTLDNTSLYDELFSYLRSPLKLREHSIQKIKSIYEPTDAQISRLRSDNDTRVNFTIQSIMSILTVVFFIWGVLSVWYQTTIGFESKLIDSVLFNSPYWPTTFTLIAGATALISVLVALSISGRNNSSNKKEIKKVIRQNRIDYKSVNYKLKNVRDCIKPNGRLLAITQIFNIFTSFIILNSDQKDLIRKEFEYIISIVKC